MEQTLHPAAIADKWQPGSTIRLNTKKEYWEFEITRQFAVIVDVLVNAKNDGRTAMIIGATGLGKSQSVDRFVLKNPLHTYRITVSSLYRLNDIIRELADVLNVGYSGVSGHSYFGTVKARVDGIIKKLIDIKRNGGNPIIIFDEAENLELQVLKMIKALYDAIRDHCSIVLIGTDQLIVKLLNFRKQNLSAIPQFYRRFKAGQVSIPSLEKNIDFLPFFERYNLEKGLCQLLNKLSDNYGELRDYLELALREAARLNVPLTEDLFRIIYNMPKN
jgi:DNA transposition AAA+ family ATPase